MAYLEELTIREFLKGGLAVRFRNLGRERSMASSVSSVARLGRIMQVRGQVLTLSGGDLGKRIRGALLTCPMAPLHRLTAFSSLYCSPLGLALCEVCHWGASDLQSSASSHHEPDHDAMVLGLYTQHLLES